MMLCTVFLAIRSAGGSIETSLNKLYADSISEQLRDIECLANSSVSPYKYYDVNGSLIDKGVSVNGTCIFLEADCEDNLNCCESQEWVSTGETNATLYANFICIGIYCGFMLLTKIMGRGRSTDTDDEISSPFKVRKGHLAYSLFGLLGYLAAIGMAIEIPIVMKQSIQQNLYPFERTAVLAADAFLIPFEEIFQFLEDTMTVRINFAIASKQYEELNILMNWGVAGGLVTGIIAALIASSLAGINKNIFVKLINPGLENDLIQYPDCGLLPSIDEMTSVTEPYWYLRSWTWPLIFIGLVLNGFFLGSGNWALYGWPSALGGAALFWVWLANYDSVENRLELLGLAYFAYSVASFAFVAVYLLLDRPLRRQYGLHFLCCPKSSKLKKMDDREQPLLAFEEESRSDRQQSIKNAKNMGWELIIEGLKAMSVDVTLQLSITIGIYVAAYHGVSCAYQLSALQSALPAFGVAWTIGFSLILKIIGAQLIASRKYEMFQMFTFFFLFLCTCFGLSSIIIFSYGDEVAYGYGETACSYATSTGCVEIYDGVFNGHGGLKSAFLDVFWVVNVLQAMFTILKASLYSCLDFTFMAKASLAALLVVFIPAILIADLVFPSNIAAIFIAMYAPHFALILVFAWRLRQNTKVMLAGGHGPWEKHSAAPAPPVVEKELSSHSLGTLDSKDTWIVN